MTNPLPAPERIVVHDLTLPSQEAQEMLRAIRQGEVDALVVSSPEGPQVLVLKGADQAQQALLETLNEGTATLAADGMILHANRKLAELLDAPPDQVLGRPLGRFVAPEQQDAFTALLDQAMNGSAKGRLALVQPGGRRVPVMISMRAVHGATAACTAVVTDMTAIEEAYAALQRVNDALEARVEARTQELSRANEALRAEIPERERLSRELVRKADELVLADQRKDEFLSMLAHELRNPLAPILLATEMMRVASPGLPVIERYRRVIERQAKNLARIVDDLLDISRITRGTIVMQRQRVELAPIVRSAIEAARSLIDAGGHALLVNLPAEPILLYADPTRFEQILVNLLNNAAKYTEHGGEIRLTAERSGDTAVIRVRDDGVGIAPDLLPRIFDLFVQGERSLDRSKGGLGIGLRMVKRLVELHEGTVEAHSEGVGLGSELVVRVPVLRGEPGQGGTGAAGQGSDPGAVPAGRKGLRVLVVEDNEDAAQMLTDLLKQWGHDVRMARDGKTGLKLAEELTPQAVLIDIGLPVMDGYEVARRMKDAVRSGAYGASDPLLICITGYGQSGDRARALEAGIDHHLTKPPDPEVLRELLARRAAAEAAAGTGAS